MREYLTSHRLVESFAPADQAHGEEGATQVNIERVRIQLKEKNHGQYQWSTA